MLKMVKNMLICFFSLSKHHLFFRFPSSLFSPTKKCFPIVFQYWEDSI